MCCIAKVHKKPIGVLQFDWNLNKTEFSIFLAPDKTHKGLDTSLIQTGYNWIKNQHPNIKQITAQILTNDISSEKAFIKCGFEKN